MLVESKGEGMDEEDGGGCCSWGQGYSKRRRVWRDTERVRFSGNINVGPHGESAVDGLAGVTAGAAGLD